MLKKYRRWTKKWTKKSSSSGRVLLAVRSTRGRPTAAAFALARDNGIPIVVFSVDEPGAIPSALLGKGQATYVMP
jgi:hypothetical protein